MVLDYESISGILPRGGTILRTSRTNPAKREGGLARCMESLEHKNLDALIAIAGDGTNRVAQELFDEGIMVVDVPQTIDNDMSGTDFCFASTPWSTPR